MFGSSFWMHHAQLRLRTSFPQFCIPTQVPESFHYSNFHTRWKLGGVFWRLWLLTLESEPPLVPLSWSLGSSLTLLAPCVGVSLGQRLNHQILYSKFAMCAGQVQNVANFRAVTLELVPLNCKCSVLFYLLGALFLLCPLFKTIFFLHPSGNIT